MNKMKSYVPLVLGACLSIPFAMNPDPAIASQTSAHVALLGSPTVTGDGPVELGPLTQGTAVGYAFADYGKLSNSSNVDMLIAPLNSGGSAVTSSSVFTLDDLIFSGPNPTVTVYLNMRLSGVLGAYYSDGATYFFSQGLVTCRATMDVTHTGSIEVFASPGGTPTHTVTTSGFLNGAGSGSADEYTVDQMVLIGPFTVATGHPVTLSVSLESHANSTSPVAANQVTVRGISSSHFEDTFEFPISSDVFNLPTGHTVDSAAGDIQANRWNAGGTVAIEPQTMGSLKASY